MLLKQLALKVGVSLYLTNQHVEEICLGQGVDGILGVGPVDLTAGTTSGGGDIPTVTDNLASQGIINTEVLGVSFVPTTSLNDVNGQLDFGGTDSNLFTGPISFVPLTSVNPAKQYWGIEQSITCVILPFLPLSVQVTHACLSASKQVWIFWYPHP